MMCDTVSRVTRWDTFLGMTQELTSLAALIQRQMDELGIKTQADLARAAKLTPQDINRFFSGGTKLPTADKRRALAKALGVSHLDLLVAAGEITEEELREAGVEGVVTRSPNDPRAQLVEVAERLEPRRVPFALRQLQLIEESRQEIW